MTPSDGAGVEPHLTIWGTDVQVQQTKKKFKQFLENFVDNFPDGGESPTLGTTPLYLSRLDEVCYVCCIFQHLYIVGGAHLLKLSYLSLFLFLFPVIDMTL